MSSSQLVHVHAGAIGTAHLGSITAILENSAAFERYLKKYALEKALRAAKLRAKTKHTIVPHVRKFHLYI